MTRAYTVREAADAIAWRPAQLAKHVGVSESLVRKWVKAKLIPTVDVDGVTLIPRVEFEEWWQARVRPGR